MKGAISKKPDNKFRAKKITIKTSPFSIRHVR